MDPKVNTLMLSPCSIALLDSLIELPLKSWSLRFSISLRVAAFLACTVSRSRHALSRSDRSGAILSRPRSTGECEGEEEEEVLTPVRTRPRIIGAASFALLSEQARVYIKMHRCALVVLLLTNRLAGSSISEDQKGRLIGAIQRRMAMLASVNAEIERRLAAISLALAVPGYGSTAIRNLYRVAGVPYGGWFCI
ncbi:hypothetical protein Ct61P_00506 [Colletotrichum tofieldiae]|nr:hypothetical protein Ct61P_00506 [Colletotrichum tofieldiae]